MIKLSHHVVSISTAAGELTGCMSEPQPGHALVLFAQGSGSSRLSPRNREMAKTLESAGFGTLLFDLLTDEEARVLLTRDRRLAARAAPMSPLTPRMVSVALSPPGA